MDQDAKDSSPRKNKRNVNRNHKNFNKKQPVKTPQLTPPQKKTNHNTRRAHTERGSTYGHVKGAELSHLLTYRCSWVNARGEPYATWKERHTLLAVARHYYRQLLSTFPTAGPLLLSWLYVLVIRLPQNIGARAIMRSSECGGA